MDTGDPPMWQGLTGLKFFPTATDDLGVMSHLVVTALATGGGAALGPIFDHLVTVVPRHAAVTSHGPGTPTVSSCTDECRPPIPHRRAFLTALSAAVFGLTALAASASWDLVVALTLLSALVPLAFCDLEHLLLPRKLVWAGCGVVGSVIWAAALTTGDEHRAVIACGCALASLAAMAALWVAHPQGLGFGDVRLALLVGLGLGWSGIGPVMLGFFAASLAAAAAGAALLLSGGAARGRRTFLPFGIFLSGGTLLSLLIAHCFA